jgi:hypothetical protein
VKSVYKVDIITPDGVLSGPRGESKIRFLVRTGKDGKKKFAVIPDLKNDEVLVPDNVRSLCTQLEIPLTDFGFTLH